VTEFAGKEEQCRLTERELKKRTNEEEYPSAESVDLNESAGY